MEDTESGRTVTKKSSIEGFYVRSAGEAWHSNLTKIPLIYSGSYFNLTGLELCLGKISPPKPPVATGLGTYPCRTPNQRWMVVIYLRRRGNKFLSRNTVNYRPVTGDHRHRTPATLSKALHVKPGSTLFSRSTKCVQTSYPSILPWFLENSVEWSVGL